MSRTTAEPRVPSSPNSADVAEAIVRRMVTVVAFLALNGVLLFVSAGRADWLWAWVFLGICLLSMAVNGTILLRKSPATIAERGRPGATQGWDRVVGGLWTVTLFLLIPLVAGLDTRFGWTGMIGAVSNILGGVVLAAGLALAGWAMIANAFFSTAVRIQEERGHAVCRSGPYRFVRHPGYVGFGLQSLATPMLLGSWWALVPGFIAVVLMVIRTSLEDRMLQRELAGYGEFTREVRYRLVPGVW